ncbi:hypothetical protein P152DRAFT_461135 [Eremomyces bilateralis CBS 781.70]|uniref:Uncharacterized protein n=1 Tax=Eremomyces bilateralis CBS 781.70 TaxID=1392243 RepID=A0A6G1FVK6_9PEZI|nr:uncharacterized protein P152DRAFT_461135 [Eremomyces bilateralis CBS 781.70]KAF1809748.1 hypothetical protein P152DRAFT_461135 [Eremomyces bilateralis CBS 781.70]
MCFYEQIVYGCGDFKWGHFRQHCNREYRIGEVCGMKLVYQSAQENHLCKVCEKLNTKYRRRQTECERIERWQREGSRQASIEKSMELIYQLDREIQTLLAERERRGGGMAPVAYA